MSSTVGTLSRSPMSSPKGTDGQYVEVDLTDAAGMPIDTGAIGAIGGTLRALDTGEAPVRGRGSARGARPGELSRRPRGVRVTFTADDMVESRRPQSCRRGA